VLSVLLFNLTIRCSSKKKMGVTILEYKFHPTQISRI
jgi:hypothetical protein